MRFGDAFKQLQNGMHIHRVGWKDNPDDGRTNWLYISWDPARGPMCHLKISIQRGGTMTQVIPYHPRTDDMMAGDWEIRMLASGR